MDIGSQKYRKSLCCSEGSLYSGIKYLVGNHFSNHISFLHQNDDSTPYQTYVLFKFVVSKSEKRTVQHLPHLSSGLGGGLLTILVKEHESNVHSFRNHGPTNTGPFA